MSSVSRPQAHTGSLSDTTTTESAHSSAVAIGTNNVSIQPPLSSEMVVEASSCVSHIATSTAETTSTVMANTSLQLPVGSNQEVVLEESAHMSQAGKKRASYSDKSSPYAKVSSSSGMAFYDVMLITGSS